MPSKTISSANQGVKDSKDCVQLSCGGMSQNLVFDLFQGITFRRKPELYVFHSEHSVILQYSPWPYQQAMIAGFPKVKQIFTLSLEAMVY